MKKILIIFISILFIGALYNEQDVFVLDEVNFTVHPLPGNRVMLQNDYYTVMIKEDECEGKDIYRFCMTDYSDSPVENYPDTYEVDITTEKICTDCANLGGTCDEEKLCERFCVHGVCHDEPYICGDGRCDGAEVCSADCTIVVDPTETTEEEIVEETPITQEEEISEERAEIEGTVVPISDAPNEPEAEKTTESQTPQEQASAPEAPEAQAPATLPAVEQPQTSGESKRVRAKKPNILGAAITVIIGGLLIVMLLVKNIKKRRKDGINITN